MKKFVACIAIASLLMTISGCRSELVNAIVNNEIAIKGDRFFFLS